MSPSPRVLRRAVLGFLTRPVALVGELPEALRPAHRAVLRRGLTASFPHQPGSELRLLSYNLQRAYRESAVICSLTAAVREVEPHLVLLQEAPRDLWLRPELDSIFGGRDLFYAPFHQVTRTSRRYRHPDYGQVIVGRMPFERPEVIELPTVTRAGLGRGHWLQRIALRVEIPLAGGRTLRLVNVHHEPFVRPAGRSPQHAAVLRRLTYRSEGIDLCAGDFNATWGVAREPGLAEWWGAGFQAALPKGRSLDNALVRGHASLKAERLALPGSDHRPLAVWIGIHLRPTFPPGFEGAS